MKFLDLVKKRQSVRKYAPRPVPRDAIERCLEAARLAPSACNSQPWSFIILDDEMVKNEAAEKAFSGAYKMNSFAKNAPVLVVVVTERSTYFARLGGFLRGTRYNLIDIGIACEHFALQAAEEGIGACFMGMFNEKAVKEALRIPRGKKVDLIISMGYPASEETREKIRKPLEEMRKFSA
jgi:nitroreductase